MFAVNGIFFFFFLLFLESYSLLNYVGKWINYGIKNILNLEGLFFNIIFYQTYLKNILLIISKNNT